MDRLIAPPPPPPPLPPAAPPFHSFFCARQVARKEREARRRRVLVDQQRAQAELEERAQVDMIVDTLQRESAEEQRLAARLWQLQQEKAVVTENRLLREQQYAERREADWRERLRREAELFRSQKEAYREEAELEMGEWRAREMAKAAAKREKHEEMAREMVWAIAGLAFRAAEYRETTAIRVPRKEFRDWTAMFVAGAPGPSLPDVHAPPPSALGRHSVAALRLRNMPPLPPPLRRLYSPGIYPNTPRIYM